MEAYIDSQMTWFVLENLETLRKNGRLSKVKAFVATALRIKPVMVSTPEGEIAQLDQARGMNKALVRMVDSIVEKVSNPEQTLIARNPDKQASSKGSTCPGYRRSQQHVCQ